MDRHTNWGHINRTRLDSLIETKTCFLFCQKHYKVLGVGKSSWRFFNVITLRTFPTPNINTF